MSERSSGSKRTLIWFGAIILLLLAIQVLHSGLSSGRAVIKPGEPALIQFYSDNCIACMAMQPVMDEVMGECDGKGIRIEQVNVRDPDVQRMAQRLGVYGVPTFIFFNSKGREYTRLIGIQPKERIERLIGRLTGGRCGYSTDS